MNKNVCFTLFTKKLMIDITNGLRKKTNKTKQNKTKKQTKYGHSISSFHPIRMTCPIHPEPYFLAAPKIKESPRIYLSLRNPQKERTSIRLLLNNSSSIIHYEESHLIYGLLGSILLDQGIIIKNNFLPSFLTTRPRSIPA